MINKLTGEPVSPETIRALERLKAGESIPLNEIQGLPEIKAAYSYIPNSTPTNELPNREDIRQGVFNRLQNMGSAVTDSNGAVSYSGEIRCEKRLDIVIGLPAAGKSSALAEPLSEFYKSRIIDSDEAKKLLPEYNGGWGAGVVHGESQDISEEQLNAALEKGENITYPRVGGDCEELKGIIEKAKSDGYKVYVHMNELNRNKALGRMISRFLETGRFLKPELITKYGDSIDNTYKELRQSPMIDGYSKWNNDVPLGHRPKLIEYSPSCVDFCKSIKPTLSEKADRLMQLYNEINTILRENPELAKEYTEKRDELRNRQGKGSHNIGIGRGNSKSDRNEQQPHEPNRKNPKHGR